MVKHNVNDWWNKDRAQRDAVCAQEQICRCFIVQEFKALPGPALTPTTDNCSHSGCAHFHFSSKIKWFRRSSHLFIWPLLDLFPILNGYCFHWEIKVKTSHKVIRHCDFPLPALTDSTVLIWAMRGSRRWWDGNTSRSYSLWGAETSAVGGKLSQLMFTQLTGICSVFFFFLFLFSVALIHQSKQSLVSGSKKLISDGFLSSLVFASFCFRRANSFSTQSYKTESAAVKHAKAVLISERLQRRRACTLVRPCGKFGLIGCLWAAAGFQ